MVRYCDENLEGLDGEELSEIMDGQTVDEEFHYNCNIYDFKLSTRFEGQKNTSDNLI